MYIALTILSAASILLNLSLWAFKGRVRTLIVTGSVLSVLTVLFIYFFTDVGAVMIFLVLSCLLVIFEFIRALTKNKINRLIPLILSVVLTLGYFTHAYIAGNKLEVTTYDIELGADLKIAQLSDIHYGNFFGEDELKKCIAEVNSNNPDVVVITGDFVDENTTLADMKRACELLRDLNSTYGTFYVPGNHDNLIGINKHVKDGYAGLLTALGNNDVKVISDKAYPIGDDFLLVGRYDTSFTGKDKRIAIHEILKRCGYRDTDRKIIVLDHKPVMLESVSKLQDPGVSLMLSGHTHGGQIFPGTLLYRLLMTRGDLLYGFEERNGTYFITSSGVSSGMIPFKNTVPNEIVIINIT